MNDDCDAALRARFSRAYHRGNDHVDVRAGELVGDVHAAASESEMRTCCAVMRAAMGPRDRIIEAPSSGYGANLTVRYALPRPS